MPNQVKVRLDGFHRNEDADNEISLVVSQVFNTVSGKEVLKYLRSITIEAVSGGNVSDAELRHLEGQRYLVGVIERRIKHAERIKADE
tara:strand:+ start:2452 stop:2715 length:264 start_codon:yes stop_codon:yes gene_type:complete